MSALAHKRARGASSSMDKENYAPSSSTMNKRAFGISSSSVVGEGSSRGRKAAKYAQSDEEEGERSEAHVERSQPKERKRIASNGSVTASKRAGAAHEQKGLSDACAKLESEDLDEEVAPQAASRGQERTMREIALQEKVDKLSNERDLVQGELDQLRELRHTQAEKQFAELKRASEQRRKDMQEKYSALQAQIAALERMNASSAQSLAVSVASTSAATPRADDTETVVELEAELARERSERRKMQEDFQRLQREYEAEIASSKALLSAAMPHCSSAASKPTNPRDVKSATAAAGAGVGLAEEEKAIRRLYEDLTGMVIRSVERQDDSGDFKTFNGIFASQGYYDVQFSIEESESEHSTSSGRLRKRQDLVFVTSLDQDRDADLLNDVHVPSYLKDVIRFERASGPKFVGAFLKGMKHPGER
ncbi:hypothetical protein K437DRAFT_294346 [Tilletiaria anomala UBC 951]|uniref:Monopolin complex subunit Csm1/Pcs1 C-terminal domain-containing protein n=1 Tax=Tilletiaria anomala (strain ATCC 24038 / CBS 436.72 / UBC 951) TaxID=1037660 RepID=A0A066W6A0_TILAU|nr:uncharacterized protein K437DRAFT_294346 [Tilletiaria anomala UBC 951]KDN46290.1 hypothetical protein K437DRAFT_294346 [Tilletiaria anomala UBC 951]